MRRLVFFVSIAVLALTATLSCSSNAVRFSGTESEKPKEVQQDRQADTALVSTETKPVDSSVLEYSYIDENLQDDLDLAEENYRMGYVATLDSNWLEAQFYFESALEILAGLDIDTETPSLAADIYSRLTNEIISDYKMTLLYIVTLPTESSPSAVIARYEDLEKMEQESILANTEPEPRPDTVVFDIPIVWNEKVERCISYFQSVGRKPFEASLARSGKYLPMMEKILEEEGIPHDLVYLPLIESGFNPRAYSWAHAVGPWQFISSTGRMYGLHRSWWYDERRDFVKSTRAAARHLRDLHEKTKDWYLALLGYNAGLGNVNKVIKKNKTRDYFKMNIRNSQMRNYVPLYLAATIIAKQPEKYGFNVDYQDPIVFDTVTVDRCLALEDIAKAVGCSYNELKALNPELLRKYTPPDIKKYTLRIPQWKSRDFWAAYPNMKSPEETSWVQHKVRKGETVSGIARKYGVSQWAIIDANNMSRPYRIGIGQKIVVPVPLGKSGSQSYSKKKYDSYDISGNYYVVRSGDTLWDLARVFGTTTRQLRSLNGLSRSGRIYVGQKLKIPNDAKQYSSTKSSKSSSGIATSTFSYKVKRGDNLWKLADKYGTTVSELRRLNGLSRNAVLSIGQKLKIPGSKTSTSAGSGTFVYTVRSGDNLWSLAQRYGTTVSRLRRLNNLSKSSTLRIGQQLKIPDSGNAGSASRSSGYYVVRRGDTLSSIANSFGISLNRLIALNSIRNPHRLAVGTRLRVSSD